MYQRLVNRIAEILVKRNALRTIALIASLALTIIGIFVACFCGLAILDGGISPSVCIALVGGAVMVFIGILLENAEKTITRRDAAMLSEEQLQEFFKANNISQEIQREWFSYPKPKAKKRPDLLAA